MKIKCNASDDEIFTEDVVQINITPTGYDEYELVLFDSPELVEVDDFVLDNRDFCTSVFVDIRFHPNLSDFFGNERVSEYLKKSGLAQISIFKNHPKFNTIIKMVEANQALW